MRWSLGLVLVAVAVVAIGAYAIGAGKSSKDLVLCANKKSGDLSLATAKGKCAKGEKKLTVAKEGPVGPAGPAGAAASSALEPVNFVKAATLSCASSPGAFCQNDELGRRWETSTTVAPKNRRSPATTRMPAGSYISSGSPTSIPSAAAPAVLPN